MTSMSSTIAALQAHNNQLQNYLSEWSRKQQGLLESIPMLPTPPSMETCNAHQEVADKASNVNAFSSVAGESETAALADLGIGEAAGNSAKRSDGDLHYEWSTRPEHVVALTSAAIEEEKEKGKDDGAPNPLEIVKSELLKQLQVYLNRLKDLRCKEDVMCWMNEILAKLEDDIVNLDIFHMPENVVDTQLPVSAFSGGLPDKEPDTQKGICGSIRGLAGAVVRSKRFELTTAAVIVFNAIIMGFSADHQMKNLDGSESSSINSMEVGFFSYYAGELFLRILYKGGYFFIGEDKYWNWFDLLLVIMSTNERIEPLYSSEGGSAALDVSFLRLVRLVKMAKLLRMIRLMKMFRQLRLMLSSIADSMQAVLWAGLLVLLMNYVSSILFVSLCTSFLTDAAEQNADVSSDVKQNIQEYFGSVPTGMHSLLGATTGGTDWFSVGAPLLEVGWACYGLFMLYFGFFFIVIINVIASLFVAVVFENSEEDKEAVIAQELERKDEYIKKLQEFYDQIDDDGDGFITYQEFSKHAHDPKFQAWASYLEIDISDAQEFFEVLTSNGTKTVDIESFVVGCIKLKGNARSVDLMAVFQLVQQIHKSMEETTLMLHVNKRHAASSANKFKEMTNEMYKANPIPMLNEIRRNQAQLLALFPELANTKELSSRLEL